MLCTKDVKFPYFTSVNDPFKRITLAERQKWRGAGTTLLYIADSFVHANFLIFRIHTSSESFMSLYCSCTVEIRPNYEGKVMLAELIMNEWIDIWHLVCTPSSNVGMNEEKIKMFYYVDQQLDHVVGV